MFKRKKKSLLWWMNKHNVSSIDVNNTDFQVRIKSSDRSGFTGSNGVYKNIKSFPSDAAIRTDLKKVKGFKSYA